MTQPRHLHENLNRHACAEGDTLYDTYYYTADQTGAPTEQAETASTNAQASATATKGLVAAFWLVFGGMYITAALSDSTYYDLVPLLAITSSTPSAVDLVISMFSHANLAHALVNSIALYSFGTRVERDLDSAIHFLGFFLAAGVIAAVLQVHAFALSGGVDAPLLGASGAICGVIGLTAVLYPNAKIALLFVITMKILKALLLFVGVSLGAVVVFGPGAGQMAHIAHSAGLLFGVGYGVVLATISSKETISLTPLKHAMARLQGA